MFTFKKLSQHSEVKGLLAVKQEGRQEERKPYPILNYFVLIHMIRMYHMYKRACSCKLVTWEIWEAEDLVGSHRASVLGLILFLPHRLFDQGWANTHNCIIFKIPLDLTFLLKKISLVFVMGSGHKASKTLGISWVMEVSLLFRSPWD